MFLLSLCGVDLGVGGKVVATSKGAVTRLTNVWPQPRVFAQMPSELVGPSKFPITSRPRALKRALSSVCARVGLEMGAFGVALAAAGMQAHVRAVSPRELARGPDDECLGLAAGHNRD